MKRIDLPDGLKENPVGISVDEATEKEVKTLEGLLLMRNVRVYKRDFKTNAATLEQQLNNYFKYCAIKGLAPIDSELALCTDMSRGEMYRLAEKDDYIGDLLKKAITVCESAAVRQLFKSGGVAAGAIFLLKNMGWTDQVVERFEDNRTITSITIYNNDPNNPQAIQIKGNRAKMLKKKDVEPEN